MKTVSFYFFIVALTTCLVCVKDLVTEGTCNFICDIESEDMTSGELDKWISEGRLIKLKLEYTARVGEACGNETLQAYENTSSTTIWLKKSNTASGAIDVFSQEMLSGEIAFVGYKHIHVSCILKLLTRNHSSQFSIKTSQSVVDIVEQFANRSNTRDAFWTLMPMGRQIYITFVVSSGNSSVASAKHWELIFSGQLWTKLSLVIYVVSIAVITLCSPVIVLAFRPSEIVGNKNNHLLLLPYSVPESESTSQEDATSHNHSGPQTLGIHDDLSSMPTNEGERVPMLQSEKYDRATAEMVTPNAKASQRSPKSGSSSASSTSGTDNATRYYKKDYAPEKMPTHHDELVEVPSADPALRDGPQSMASRDSGGPNNHTIEHLVAIPETSGNLPEGGERVASESTDEIRMIPVGKNPVALESWIGNCLFIISAKGRNSTKSLDTPKDIARYILCYFSPVLVIFGLGDLSLVMLKYSSSRPDDFPSNCLIVSIFTWWRIVMAIVIIFVQCLQSYYARKWAAKSINVWRSCFVHCNHLLVFSRLKCFFNPCSECKNSPPDCPIQVDIPNNIVHNSDKVTEGFLNHCKFFANLIYKIEFKKTIDTIKGFAKVILGMLLIINFFMDVLLASPIVCSFQPRIWLLKESPLKDRFRFPRFDIVCDILEALVKLGLFAWLVYYAIYDAIYIIHTIVGFITLILKNFPDQVHKHVLVVFFLYYYCFRCYFCFKAYYCKLVQELYKSYMKKYDEIKKATKPIELVNYRQGDYIAIEFELFEFAIHHEAIELPRNRVCDLLKKIGGMFLIFAMIYLAISTPVKIEIVFAFFVVYWYADSFINDIKFEQLEFYAGPIVDDFINKKK